MESPVYRSIRLDVGERKPEDVQNILFSWLEANKGQIPKAAVALEHGSVTGKLHFQGVVTTTLNNKRFHDRLNAFESWAPNEKSFAIVKKPESYLKYIKKEGNIVYYHGFSQEDIESWGKWEIKATKAEAKLTSRETFYKEFLEFCRKDPRFDTGKYKLDWIGRQFFKYWGKSPKPELTNWIKGVVFSAQTALLHGEESEAADKAVDRWVDRILS